MENPTNRIRGSFGNMETFYHIMKNTSTLKGVWVFPYGNERKRNVSKFPVETFPTVSNNTIKYIYNVIYINKLSKSVSMFPFIYMT